jgi:cob(I)alamin adenosyltransferase
MKIYTRSGDAGQTGLPGRARVPKDAPELEVCGTLDELNATLGLARAESLPEDVDRLLHRIQEDLFSVAADMIFDDSHRIGQSHVADLERAIDHYDAKLEPLGGFIVPGGTRAAAATHVARTVCRRAERRIAALARDPERQPPPLILAYLNRLSDLLFVLARFLNPAP